MPTRAPKTRAPSYLACCVTLAACTLLARAQIPPLTKDVILKVAALDAKGHPVTDLTSADFRIFDDGKLQQIASFKPIDAQPAAGAPPATLILFDLLNSIPGQREYTSNLIIHALEPLATGDSVYLYLLANNGDVYPVHPLDADGNPAGAPWTRRIHPLLDGAIQHVYGVRPMDDRDAGIRAAVTFRTLGELGAQFMKIPGPKAIVWITRGVLNSLHYPYGCKDVAFAEGSGSYLAGECTEKCAKWTEETKCIDFAPFLQHFSAALNRTGTIVYPVEVTNEGFRELSVRLRISSVCLLHLPFW